MATYRLPAAAGSGYTLMGSATVIAKISSPTANSELAARLLDVDPSGTETLVARQLFRPQVGTARQVFQLHPSGHLFAPGHVAKLELLPKDAGGTTLNSYGRAANGQGDITVSNLDLRLPVTDDPGAAGGQVGAAPPLSLPCGSAIAPEFSSASYLRASLGDGKVKAKGKAVKVPVDSAPGTNPCRVQVQLLGSGKGTKASSAKKKKKKARCSAAPRRPSPEARARRSRSSSPSTDGRRSSAAQGPGAGDHDRLGRQHRADHQGEARRQEAQEEAPLSRERRVSRRAALVILPM